MNVKRLIVYVGVIAGLCAGSMIQAQMYDHWGKDGKEMGERRKELGDKIIKELDLTAEQEKQMKEQREKTGKKNKAIRKELGEKMKKLKEELEKKDVDRRKIDAIAEEIKTLKGSLIDQRIDSVLAMKQILTTEQYEKLKELRKKRHAERRKVRKGKKGKRNNKREECPPCE